MRCGGWRWRFSYDGRDIRFRTHLSNDVLHLAAAFVPGAIQKSVAVSKRHYRHKQIDSGQGERPVGQPIENLGKFARASRRRDAAVRGVLRQKQDICAVNKERGAADAKIEAAGVELTQVSDELGSRSPLLCCK